jgi:DNA-binding NarL/FixJ family response regulator
VTPVRVLVVDDQAAFRHAARELLEQKGYVVVGEASGAADAQEAAARLRPDAVLLDVRLGDDNGFEVSAALTRAHPTLAVLLVSADAEYACCHERAAASGARGIMAKSTLAATDLAGLWPTPVAD